MTEYIAKCNEVVGISGKALIVPDYIDTSKEVVRCRDCKFSRIHDGNSWPGNKHKEYVGKTYCIAWGDGMQGEWTDPDGYCHKAKRKEDGE